MAIHWTGPVDHAVIDKAMPEPDYVVTEQLVLPVPAEEAFDAVSRFDLNNVRQPAVRAAFWLRRLPGPQHIRVPARQASSFTLDDLVIDTNWLLLGRRPSRDVVLDAIGRIWTPMVRWKYVAADDFAKFDEPSWAKIVIGFTVLPFGDNRSIVAHEVRIYFCDRGTQKTFTMFWGWLIRPLVRVGLRATLHAIKDTATAAANSPTRRDVLA